jgi:hypothetical protein
LYGKLQGLRDPSGCRIVYSQLFCGKKEVLPFRTVEDKVMHGEKAISELLESTNYWTLQSTWYVFGALDFFCDGIFILGVPIVEEKDSGWKYF